MILIGFHFSFICFGLFSVSHFLGGHGLCIATYRSQLTAGLLSAFFGCVWLELRGLRYFRLGMLEVRSSSLD